MSSRTMLALAALALACGSSNQDGLKSGGGGAAAGGTSASGGAAGTGGSAAAAPAGVDPTKPGPYAAAAFDATADVAATAHSFAMHCVVPSNGPEAAPYPVVIIAHGFQLPASQYYGYADRLGSFGFVACTADYPAGFVPNHAQAAEDISGALDWILVASVSAGSPLNGQVDGDRVGVMGHSLGGKVSVLAAAGDARFVAVLGLDPVDTSTLCNPTDCPDASSKLPLPIPSAFLGETTDSAGGLQPCAPAADNYQTFYAAAAPPSVEVTLLGANHMSFLDDPASCGLTCSLCNPATLPHDSALFVTRAYAVAFFERHLRAAVAFDGWLTGAEAQASFVSPGLIGLHSK